MTKHKPPPDNGYLQFGTIVRGTGLQTFKPELRPADTGRVRADNAYKLVLKLQVVVGWLL